MIYYSETMSASVKAIKVLKLVGFYYIGFSCVIFSTAILDMIRSVKNHDNRYKIGKYSEIIYNIPYTLIYTFWAPYFYMLD